MVELVDTLDLKSNGYLNARAGSSPAAGTSKTAGNIDINEVSFQFNIQMPDEKPVPPNGVRGTRSVGKFLPNLKNFLGAVHHTCHFSRIIQN